MMEDTSKGRRMTGKLAIFAVAAIALPLTATVVPVMAEEAAAPDNAKKIIRHKTKIIMVRGKDGKMETIDVSGDADTPFVKKIEKDGKTIILRSNRELSDAEIDKMVAEAEKSRTEAEIAAGEAEAAKEEADAAMTEAENATIYLQREKHEAAKVAVFVSNGEGLSQLELVTGKIGYPMTESTYREIRAIADRFTDEKQLLETTLQAMIAARDGVAQSKMIPKDHGHDVLEELDREIRHLKVKIERTPDTRSSQTDGGDA